jgi:hypothetical protein
MNLEKELRRVITKSSEFQWDLSTYENKLTYAAAKSRYNDHSL